MRRLSYSLSVESSPVSRRYISPVFSPFAVISLCGVVSLLQRPFHFCMSVAHYSLMCHAFRQLLRSDSVFPPRLRSSARALISHLQFDKCCDVFCFVSYFTVPEPLQNSPPLLPAISPNFSDVSIGSHPLPIAPSSFQLLSYTFHLLPASAMFYILFVCRRLSCRESTFSPRC